MSLLTELWHEFGQSKELKKEIDLRTDLMDLNLEYLIEGDRCLLNDIKIVKAELEKLLKESSNSVDFDFDKEVGKVAQHLGRAINQKETTIFEYYAATKV